MRLDKYLTKTIIGSRKLAKELIKKRQILVDDIIVKSDSYQVKEDANVYYIQDGKKIKLEYEEHIYLMLNKPAGYVCATKDNLHKSVLELITDYQDRDLHIVGRLDVDTEGLLLITDDGDFTHQVTSPKSNISKKYYVEYQGTLDDFAIDKVKNGIILDDGEITKPGILEPISGSSAYITIYEGRFHQVKRMFADLGTKVTYLKRVQISSLELNVECGQYRKLNKKEIDLRS